jgi:hypothetical protein
MAVDCDEIESGLEPKGVNVNYSNLLEILNNLNQKQILLHQDYILLGSWALVIYAKKNNLELGDRGIGRKTSDIDLLTKIDMVSYLSELELDIKLSDANTPYLGTVLKGNDFFIEFFTPEALKDIQGKEGKDLIDKIIEASEDVQVNGFKIKVCPEYLWLGLKLSAWDKTHDEKHRHDIFYFRGLIGDKTYEDYLQQLQDINPKYRTIADSLYNKLDGKQTSLDDFKKAKRRD